MYSEKVLEHFQNPRNTGELNGADAAVEVSNPVCGDVLKLAVNLKNGRIEDARFLCRGCTTAIACGSVLTEKMVGMELPMLSEISAEVVAGALGGVPEASFHAAQLAEDAVRALVVKLKKAKLGSSESGEHSPE
jgi:nitrogen fixation protein NifU and related proteins